MKSLETSSNNMRHEFMTTIEKKRSLVEELTQLNTEEKQNKNSQTCALDIQRACCNGRGFSFRNNSAPYAEAYICKCVQECKLCQGKMKLILRWLIVKNCLLI